jgi:anti-sigma B factor antagonist
MTVQPNPADSIAPQINPLELSDIQIDAHRHVLVVVGELDLFGVPELKRRLAELIEHGIRRVVVDLSAVTFLDSTALGALLGGMRRLRARGGDLAVVNLNPSISQLLRVTGLDQILAVLATREEALARLSDGG